MFRCGWIPDSEWAPDTVVHSPIENTTVSRLVRMPVAGGHPNPDTCAGYTTQLPQVHEVARAWGWWDKGHHLGEFYGCQSHEVPQDVRDLVELYHQARAGAEAWYYEQRDARDGR